MLPLSEHFYSVIDIKNNVCAAFFQCLNLMFPFDRRLMCQLLVCGN